MWIVCPQSVHISTCYPPGGGGPIESGVIRRRHTGSDSRFYIEPLTIFYPST